MKMKDLIIKKMEEKDGCCGVLPMNGRRPTVYMNAEQLPDLASWEIGKEYLLKVKQVSKDDRVNARGERNISAEFEVMSAGIAPEDMKSEEAPEEEESKEEDTEEEDESDDVNGVKKVTIMRMKLKPSNLMKKIVKDEYGK